MTKQIDIKELIPFMKDGWVAMDKNEEWFWFEYEPKIDQMIKYWVNSKKSAYLEILPATIFDIKPVSDWTKSLIKVENKDE